MVGETVERVNPFVGPQPFTRSDTIYGRERETEDLFNLLISGRVVLMYAASGAGKTSLIQAALIPRMIEEGFTVLDNLRVNIEPEDSPAAGAMNRYIYSILDSLEDARLGGHDQEGHLSPEEFLEMGLDGYLTRYHPQSPSLLVFDQFEEILTLNPVDLEAKKAFFDAVGRALQDPTRWALFSMREDYRAALDPYVEPLPTRFKNTYRLDLLTRDTAIQVIRNTARQANVDFHQAAAKKLVENLSRVQVMRLDGTMEDLLGPFIEPVQLQVVGLDLFDRLDPGDTDITETEIDQLGDVDQALGRYYTRQVEAVATAASPDQEPSGEPTDQAQKPKQRKKVKKVKRSPDQELAEMVTRNWFEEKLITPAGVRDQLLMAAGSSGGLENWRIDRLEDAHLVRKDRRRGRTWIELAHDRLVAPMRKSNAAWFHGRRLGSLRRAAPWLIGSLLAMAPFVFLRGQASWTTTLLVIGSLVLVTPSLLPRSLLPIMILIIIGACMLFILVSFAGANALGRQIARLRLPHGLGFSAVFLAIFVLIFVCSGLLLFRALA